MKIFKLMILSLAMVTWLGGCMDVNDDIDQLKKDVSALGERLTTTEDAVKSLQADISAGKLITSVNPYTDPSTGVKGWEIVFSDDSKKYILDGETGADGKTPFVWINDNGNWAVSADGNGKPADSNNAKYEIKNAQGLPIISEGISMKVVRITKNGVDYIGFQQYYKATNANVGEPIETNFPFDGGKIITAIGQSDDTYTFTIDGVDYILPRAAIYPTSVTVLRYATSVIKGGELTFGVRVNPSDITTITKEDVSLIYVESYKSKASYGVVPDFITVKDFTPTDVKGEYKVDLSWAKGRVFPKDAAIYVVVHYTDTRGEAGKACEVTSSTPIILNEQYVSLLDRHVKDLPDVYIFADEVYVDSVRLVGYHEDYINTITHVLTTVKPIDCTGVDIRSSGLPTDKFKFSISGCNNHTHGEYDVVTKVTDHGRAKVDAIPADPYTNTPGTPEMPAIPANTVNKTFKVYNYYVLDYVVDHKIADRWLPNATYSMEKNALDTMIREGYRTEDNWSFEITKFDYRLTKDGVKGFVTPLPASITTDITNFSAAGNYSIKVGVDNTVDYGTHEVYAHVKATTSSRHHSLDSERTFIIRFIFTLVPPMFEVNLKSVPVDGVFAATNTYTTYKNEDVVLADVINVASNKNVSQLHADIAKLGAPLAYTYAAPQDIKHEQGLYFSVYPKVNKPATPTAWPQTTPVRAYVKLATGQEIPVMILKSNGSNGSDPVIGGAKGLFNILHAKPVFTGIEVAQAEFYTSYNKLQSTTLDISKTVNALANFTAEATNGTVTKQPLPANCIASITYAVTGVVRAVDGAALPSGLPTTLLKVNAAGAVSAVDHSTWVDNRTLCQDVAVTITDIWGNAKSATVTVYFNSSSDAQPIIP